MSPADVLAQMVHLLRADHDTRPELEALLPIADEVLAACCRRFRCMRRAVRRGLCARCLAESAALATTVEAPAAVKIPDGWKTAA